MIIDGVEYVIKEKTNSIDVDFVKKETIESIDLSNYMIIDPCNVLAIVPIDKNFYFEDTFELDVPKRKQTYKLINDELITPIVKGLNINVESYKISNSKYSKEFIDIAIKTSKAFGYKEKPEIFLQYDKTKNEFVEDNPCLIVFERRLCFILAPRIGE